MIAILISTPFGSVMSIMVVLIFINHSVFYQCRVEYVHNFDIRLSSLREGQILDSYRVIE
jgi:hypothetical protein